MQELECLCDKADCERNWVCARLGKLRIAHEIVRGLDVPTEHLKPVLDDIEFQCEILCK